jgi:hypothetical protein
MLLTNGRIYTLVHGIHAAVTRRPRTNEDRGWQPEQRMVRAEIVCRHPEHQLTEAR